MIPLIQSNNSESINDDEFVDAKESWETKEKTEFYIKETEELLIKQSRKDGTRRNSLLVPKKVANKLPISLHNLGMNKQGFKGVQRNSIEKLNSIPINENSTMNSDNISTSRFDINVERSYCSEGYSKDRSIKRMPRTFGFGKIPINSSKKRYLEFDNVIFQQELYAGNGSIWVSEFSQDGCFFATGSNDGGIRIWEVSDFQKQCISFLQS